MKVIIVDDDVQTVSSIESLYSTLGVSEEDIVRIDCIPREFKSWEDYLLSVIKEIKRKKEGIILFLDRELYEENTKGLFHKLLDEKILERGDSVICNSGFPELQFDELYYVIRDLGYKNFESEKEDLKILEADGVKVIQTGDLDMEQDYVMVRYSEPNVEIFNEGTEIRGEREI